MNGAQLFVRELQRHGVPYVATLCGHGLNPFDKACRQAGMRLIDVRNEQSAGYMAEITGRLTRRPGVAAVSSGVAHVNGMTGLVNAYFDGAPMLLVTGSGSTETMGLGHFQDLDQVALAAPVCKYARVVDRVERIPQIVAEALAASMAGRPGPVHLTLPLNVQTAEVVEDSLLRVALPADGRRATSATDEQAIAGVAGVLARAQRPLIIAGSGAYYAEAESALRDFAARFAIPVVVPIWDRGSIPQPMPEFVGVLGAATGGPRLLADADALILIGATCDYRVGFLQPPAIRPDAKIIRIDVDPRRLEQGVGAHYPILGDPRRVLQQLETACAVEGVKPYHSWIEEAQSRRRAFCDRVRDVRRRHPGGIHASDVADAVHAVMTDDTILLLDGGNIGQWMHQLICDRYPSHWVTCGASGVIGFGLAGGMAARALHPDRPIILVSGDGSFTFTVAEIERAVHQGLNFVVVLADDQAWGITLTGQMKELGEGVTAELGAIQFARLAESLGARGVRVSAPQEILPALRDALAADRLTLIHVPVIKSNPGD